MVTDVSLAMRRATRALAYASVGVLGRLVAPTAPTPRAWRACAGCRDFASATSDESQQRLFEHYAMGLRGILASTDSLEDPSVMRRLRALRDDAPVALEHPSGARSSSRWRSATSSASPPRTLPRSAPSSTSPPPPPSADSSRTRPFAPPTVSSEASAS